ncbi:CAP domain-containing protein [Phytomonospora sp. NPDC050363]|uniref:CAP domain-containing protein n=1 Tax=Phytomonospora sp. NPDC050363 TaxID=3155642 RepID=UPI00340D3E71
MPHPHDAPPETRPGRGRHARRVSPRRAVVAGIAAAATVSLGLAALFGLGGDPGETARPSAASPSGSTPTEAVPEPSSAAPSSEASTVTPKTKPPAEPEDEETADPGPAGPAGGEAARFAARVAELVNDERAEAGCGALRVDAKVTSAAQAHADDMGARDYFAHDSPEGRSAGDRLDTAGYAWSGWGENIAKGSADAEQVMRGWMDSPGHRANILNCDFDHLGVGVNLDGGGPWWVQVFGSPR